MLSLTISRVTPDTQVPDSRWIIMAEVDGNNRVHPMHLIVCPTCLFERRC